MSAHARASTHGKRNPCRCTPCKQERALLPSADALILVEGYCDRLAAQTPPPAELAAAVVRRTALRALVGAA